MEKIQELTDKIRREGGEKGQEEAARIVAEAKQQAAKIVADAKAQAEAIAQKAKKDAAELDQNTKSELRLYTSQALNALKSEITELKAAAADYRQKFEALLQAQQDALEKATDLF